MLRSILEGLGGILALLVLGYLFYSFSGEIAGWLSIQDPGLGAAVVTGTAAVFGYLYTQFQQLRKSAFDALRENKISAYEPLLKIVDDLVDISEREELIGSTLRDLHDMDPTKYKSIASNLVAWGSPGVIQAWNKLRKESPETEEVEQCLLLIDDLIKSIRSDLRNHNFLLNRGELVNVYLKAEDHITS